MSLPKHNWPAMLPEIRAMHDAGATIQAMCDALSLPYPTLTRKLADLRAAGVLVARAKEAPKPDARKIRLAAGAEPLPACHEISWAVLRSVLDKPYTVLV